MVLKYYRSNCEFLVDRNPAQLGGLRKELYYKAEGHKTTNAVEFTNGRSICRCLKLSGTLFVFLYVSSCSLPNILPYNENMK